MAETNCYLTAAGFARTVYFNVRGFTFVLSGRDFAPVVTHKRVHFPFALSVVVPALSEVTSGVGRMHAFFGVYHFHFAVFAFFVEPNGA